jgi:hypothetical protein
VNLTEVRQWHLLRWLVSGGGRANAKALVRTIERP